MANAHPKLAEIVLRHSCQIVNRIVNRFFIFMYHVSYRIVYYKIHKYYINFIENYTYTHTHTHIYIYIYIYYKFEIYANNDYFNYHLCYSILLS